MMELAHLAGAAFHHGLTHTNLPIPDEHYFSTVANR
jgi:hypothetical protein